MIRLLIVDDSPLMRKLLSEIFAEAGDFEIEVARTGAEALSRLESFGPDVVTLDIHMPEMDGIACLDRIMVQRPCPVVMVSSLTEAGVAETLEALELGAVDFIAKPRGPISLQIDHIADELVGKVRNATHARISRAARLAERVRLGKRRGRMTTRRSASSLQRESEVLANVELVLVGVSTGGPSALDTLLQPLPADFPWPVVIAQHMPATFTGALARRLDSQCALSVLEVSRTMPIEPGHVYIGKGEADLLITKRGGRAAVTPAPSSEAHIWHPSVDRLVRSAVDFYGAESLIGVLMTGMGTDGADAMAELRRAGGHVIAQDEASSVVWGMPGALVGLDGADHILSPNQIAEQLTYWAGK